MLCGILLWGMVARTNDGPIWTSSPGGSRPADESVETRTDEDGVLDHETGAVHLHEDGDEGGSVSRLACVLSWTSAARADITFFDVFKNADYVQTSDAQPANPVGYFRASRGGRVSRTAGDLTGRHGVVPEHRLGPPSLLAVGRTPASSPYAVPEFRYEVRPLDAGLPERGRLCSSRSHGGTFDGQSAVVTTPAADADASAVPFFSGNTYYDSSRTSTRLRPSL